MRLEPPESLPSWLYIKDGGGAEMKSLTTD